MIIFSDETVVYGKFSDTLTFILNARVMQSEAGFEQIFQDYANIALCCRSIACSSSPMAVDRLRPCDNASKGSFPWKPKKLKTAIVTNSQVTRFVVAALSLFVSHINAYEVRELDRALSALRLSEDEIKLVMREISVLQHQVSKTFSTFHKIECNKP